MSRTYKQNDHYDVTGELNVEKSFTDNRKKKKRDKQRRKSRQQKSQNNQHEIEHQQLIHDDKD